MADPCRIIWANYEDLGFGDPELNFESGFFQEISNEINDNFINEDGSNQINFVQDNFDNMCNQSTLYSNTGYADVNLVIYEKISDSLIQIAYANQYNKYFGSSNISFPKIEKFVNRFRKTTTYRYGIVDIDGSSTSHVVNLPDGVFSFPPVVNCTPVGENINIYITDITNKSFKLNNLPKKEFKVNYFASQNNFIFT